MHLASPAATVWCSCPPSVCLYPTFISISVLPSIYLFSSSGGELWGFYSIGDPVWRRIIWRLWILHCSGCYMLSISCVCVWPRNAFPLELTKIPTLRHKVSVNHTDERQRKKDPWEKSDKTLLSLTCPLIFIHIPPSSPHLLSLLMLCCCLKGNETL